MKKINNILFAILILFGFTSNSIARDQIKIVGSSTVYPYTTVVAENFGKQGGFKTPVVESTGTGGGMKLFCSGVGTNYPDITNASRAIKDSEKELCKKNGVTDIIEIIIGNDGISLSHSVNAPDANFTKEQLWRALAMQVDVNGELVDNPYKNWSDIDSSLPNTKIEILIAPPTSGTRDAWNSLVMEKACSDIAKSKFKESGKKSEEECIKIREDGYAVEAGENDTLIVQKLASNPNAFGFFGYSYLINNKDKVKASAIEGVIPTLEGIQDYSYPIARPLFFYVKKSHIGIIPGIQEFMKEFTSQKAMGLRGYLADIGLVPLSSDKYKTTRSAALDLNTISIE